MPQEHEDFEHTTPWTLGFVVEEPTLEDLLRHKFPSKVGGRPAWLDPVNLPQANQLSTASGRPLSFLLQVYCPIDDNAAAFHRTIFVFTTLEGQDVASRGSVRALRCQLPRDNQFYAFSPSKERFPSVVADAAHADDPWQVAQTEACMEASRDPPRVERHLLPEQRLVTDSECRPTEAGPSLSDAPGEAGEAGFSANDLTPDVEAAISASTTLEQKHFANFATRIAWDPDQVLRYCFEEGAEPLWPNPAPIPQKSDIPVCDHCKGPRTFEFQVLPQLLNHLAIDDEGKDSLDFGAIAVYSCKASCQGPGAYAEEFVWVQPP